MKFNKVINIITFKLILNKTKMKKLFFILITLLVINNAQSQDIVLKKNGEELKVKITEIGDTQLKYEKPGLTIAFTLSLADVLEVTIRNR